MGIDNKKIAGPTQLTSEQLQRQVWDSALNDIQSQYDSQVAVDTPSIINTPVNADKSQTHIQPVNIEPRNTESEVVNAAVNKWKINSGKDILDLLTNYVDPPMSKEDLEKERKKQRTRNIISGVSDAATALSNLIATTEYAPNMYDPRNSMSEVQRKRWEKFLNDYNADRDRWLNYLLKRHQLESEGEKWQYNVEKDAKIENRQAEKDKYDRTVIRPLKERQLEADIEESRQRKKYYENGGGNRRTTSTSMRGNIRDIRPWRLTTDKTYIYDNEDNYKKAVIKAAKELGIQTTETQTSTTTKMGGIAEPTEKVVNRRIEDIAADVERIYNRRNGNNKATEGKTIDW